MNYEIVGAIILAPFLIPLLILFGIESYALFNDAMIDFEIGRTKKKKRK